MSSIEAMKCPDCNSALQRVRQDEYSMLNSEQFDAVKAGDWFCTRCPSDGKARTGYRYFWNHDLDAAIKAAQPQNVAIPDEILEWIGHMNFHLTEHDERHAGLALRAAWPQVRDYFMGSLQRFTPPESEQASAISDERIFELATELIGDKWPLENSPQPLIQFARALLSERPGLVSVPREPTEEMLDAICNIRFKQGAEMYREIYKTMISAYSEKSK
jgi:hypothetical protein